MNYKKLPDICNITTGKLDANAAVAGGAYPFFTCAPEPTTIDSFAFDCDAILLAGNNAQGNFHITRYNGKFNAYQRTYVITGKDGYNIDFIKYMLELSLTHFKSQAQGSQTKFLTIQILNSFSIPDIPMEDQFKIVSPLVALDRRIDNNNNICAELEAMAKTLYDYWFVQFDFPDENGKPYRTSGGAMEWCQELGRKVPKGWRAIDILTLCDVVDCLHSKKPEYFFEYEDSYMLTLENLTKEGYIDLSEKFYISKSDYDEWVSRIEVQENDFVVTNAGRAGDIGKIPHGVKCAIGRNLTAIRPKGISAYYLREYFKSDFVKQQILSNLDSGSFFMSFNVKSIKKMMILIPDSRTLASYLQLAKPIIQRIESIIAESQQLTILRDWLLPMLMNGQAQVEK